MVGTLWDALGLAATEADHVKVWQTVGKLRRWHGLVMSGEPQEPGYAVSKWGYVSRRRLRNSIIRGDGSLQLGLFDWTWEAKRMRSAVRQG